MATMDLTMGLSAPDLGALLRAVAKLDGFAEQPMTLSSGNSERKAPKAWVDAVLGADESAMVMWPDGAWLDYSERSNMLKVSLPRVPRDPQAVLAILSELPFELASFKSVHPEWRKDGYRPATFADAHWRHGWACAFKGAGHDRLVSRRWLDHSPWVVLRGPNDTTLVEFHTLDVDADTARNDATAGHLRMGISDSGGFLQTNYVYAHEIGGVYDPADRSLRIVVNRRDVSEREMMDACAVRYYKANDVPDEPIEHIAYVFVEQDAARAHLHELWLRDLQCWTFIDGAEVRIDDEYDPDSRA